MGRPSVYPTGTTKYVPEKCQSGYTLFPGQKKGAVLIDMNGRIVRFYKDFQGMPNKMIRGGYLFGALGRRDHTAAYQDYTDLTEEQLANRQLLKETMKRHGFVPLAEEWWHFTLKDEPYPDTYFDFPVRHICL